MRMIDVCLAWWSPRCAAHGAVCFAPWALGLTLVLLTAHSFAAQVTLTWDPSPSDMVDGYRLYYGTQSRSYTASLDVGPATIYTLTKLVNGQTYYFAVTAYDNTTETESAWSNEVSTTLPPSSAAEVIVDNQDPNTAQTGVWDVSHGASPWEEESLYSATKDAAFRWTPMLPVAGTYTVYAWWTYTAVRATAVPYEIHHQAGTTTVMMNQQNVALAGRWNLLGTFSFDAGSAGWVTVSGQNGNACADAVRFVQH